MFVAIVGVAVVGAAAHDDHSDYYKYREYNDSALVEEINTKIKEHDRQVDRMNNLRDQLAHEFNSRIVELQTERWMASLSDAEWSSDFSKLFQEVRKEVISDMDSELEEENQQLEQIDNMIARINQIALQETGGK